MNFFRRLSSKFSKNPPSDPLWHAVNALIRARDYGELWPIFGKHPELLKRKADKLLKQRITEAHKRGNEDTEKKLIERHKFLQRVRKIGIEAAFAELEENQQALPPLTRALGGFIRIHTYSELWTYVNKNPDLLSNKADELLEERITIAQEQDAENVKQALEKRRNLLHLIRQTKQSSEYTGCPEDMLRKFVQARELTVQCSSSEDAHIFDEAVSTWQAILDHSLFSTIRSNFAVDVLVSSAHLLMYGYRTQNNRTHLDQALVNWQKVIALISLDSSDLPIHLKNLGDGFKTRYELTNNLEDLEQAIEAYKKMVELIPSTDSTRPMLLNSLGLNLRARYQHTNNLFDLEGAIHFCQEAIDTTSKDSSNRPVFLNNRNYQAVKI